MQFPAVVTPGKTIGQYQSLDIHIGEVKAQKFCHHKYPSLLFFLPPLINAGNH